jgi:Tfp pilus assembly protein PilX
MGLINKSRLSSEKGFALVTAIMACAILFALAMLILNLSTGDLRVSSRSVGDKKASIAAETGIQQVLTSFDPENPPSATNVEVDTVNAPGSVYSFAAPAPPTSGSAFASLTGYAIGGGQSWGLTRYGTTITGQNTRYNTSVQVNVGIGYGPVEISTMSR